MEGPNGSEQVELLLSDIQDIIQAECEWGVSLEISRPSRWPWIEGIVTTPRRDR